MKRFVSVIAGLLAVSTLVFAQGIEPFGESISEKTHRDFGSREQVSFNGLSYIGVGFHAPFYPVSNDYLDHTSFFKNVEFFFNLAELQFHPYSGGSISIGVDMDWDYYKMSKDYMWHPITDGTIIEPVAIETQDIKRVKKSQLSVMSFEFPITFEHKAGAWSFRAGVVPEINLNGIARFKGIDARDSNINDNSSGAQFSNGIITNRFTYSFLAAVNYGGLGIYARYNPKPQLRLGYGPQFSSVTVGLVIGFGM